MQRRRLFFYCLLILKCFIRHLYFDIILESVFYRRSFYGMIFYIDNNVTYASYLSGSRVEFVDCLCQLVKCVNRTLNVKKLIIDWSIDDFKVAAVYI